MTSAAVKEIRLEVWRLRMIVGHLRKVSPAGQRWLRDRLTADLGSPPMWTTEYAVSGQNDDCRHAEGIDWIDTREYIAFLEEPAGLGGPRCPNGPHRVASRMVTPWEPLPDEREAYEDA